MKSDDPLFGLASAPVRPTADRPDPSEQAYNQAQHLVGVLQNDLRTCLENLGDLERFAEHLDRFTDVSLIGDDIRDARRGIIAARGFLCSIIDGLGPAGGDQ